MLPALGGMQAGEKFLKINFDEMVSAENLLEAWKEFERGKKSRKDVQEFSLRLMDNIFSLHRDLVNHTHKHGDYQAFNSEEAFNQSLQSYLGMLMHCAGYKIKSRIEDIVQSGL